MLHNYCTDMCTMYVTAYYAYFLIPNYNDRIHFQFCYGWFGAKVYLKKINMWTPQ